MKNIFTLTALTAFIFMGCAKPIKNIKLKRLHSYHTIPIYGINSTIAPLDYRYIGPISISHKGSVGINADDELRKRALLLGGNTVVKVKKSIESKSSVDQFGRINPIQTTSGHAVFDPKGKKSFVTKELVEFFNQEILGIPKMKGRDQFNSLESWQFFITSQGDILCEKEEAVAGQSIWQIETKKKQLLIKREDLESF